MKIGYARVSTQAQDLSLQLDALQAAECTTIYQEKASGAKKERPELEKMMRQLRAGDVVIVWKLDRLARSMQDLVRLVNEIQGRGAELQSLNDHIDTTSPTGKFTFHIFAALAEFERDIIRERTKAGLAVARARGRVGGRPKGLSQKATLCANMILLANSIYPGNGRKAVKWDTLVPARFLPVNHASSRVKLIAVAVKTCCRCVLAKPR